MRTTPILRYLALLLLLAGAFAVPAMPSVEDTGVAIAVAQDDDGDDDEEEREEDREEEQEEREEEREEREEDREEKRREKEQDRNNRDKDDSANLVEPVADYGVDVACTTVSATSTECTVTGVTPDNGKKISYIVIPEAAVCTGVIGGEHQYVDPDRQTDVTGYKSWDAEGSLTLILDGQVTTGGAATYWLRAANEIFPATGPGFFCDEPVTTTPEVTPEAATQGTSPATVEVTLEATPDDAAATGTVTVSTYGCTEVPADTSAYDWYGACDAGGDHRFVLAPVEDDATGPLAADTAKTGEATFADLPPGLYDLDDVNANWCHAESDAVNAEGEVMVEAGAETTVWLFYCHDGGGS